MPHAPDIPDAVAPPAASSEDPDSWKRTVLAIWISQFMSTLGFSFAMPFAPYYIQELGVTEPAALRLWTSLFAAATPLTLAVFSPIWGALADRYGRRLMLLRANFGAAAVLTLMGLVVNVQQLIFLRLMQGVFTGTVTAAQAMAVGEAPANRSGTVLGALSAAVFSGSLCGAFVGGIFSDAFGHRLAFILSGVVMLLAGSAVLLFTRERSRPAPAAPRGNDAPVPVRAAQFWNGMKRDLFQARTCLPILLTMTVIAFVRQFDNALMPLLVQEIHGSMAGASFRSGAISAACGVAGLLAGITIGRLADRVSPPKIAKFSALGAGLLMIPQAFTGSLLLFTGARFGMIFCSGGLEPVFQIWLAKITPEKQRGAIFGWAATARSVGWIFSPLVSGAFSMALGVRAIYLIGALLFLLLIPWILLIVRRVQHPQPTAA